MAPGGTLFLVGHDRSNIEEGVGGPQNPAVLYTPEEIVASLDGLEVVRAERVTRDVEEGTAIDALVSAVRPARGDLARVEPEPVHAPEDARVLDLQAAIHHDAEPAARARSRHPRG